MIGLCLGEVWIRYDGVNIDTERGEGDGCSRLRSHVACGMCTLIVCDIYGKIGMRCFWRLSVNFLVNEKIHGRNCVIDP